MDNNPDLTYYENENLAVFPEEKIVTDGLWSECDLINGVGGKERRNVYERYCLKHKFLDVTHPTAIHTGNIEFGNGHQIMAGAVIQPGVKIGKNVLINTRASIDHDCTIGDHTHIAPGVIVCGGVKIGKECFIGAGTTIIQNVTIEDNSFIPAGSIITKDVHV